MIDLASQLPMLADPLMWLYVVFGVGLGLVFGALPGFTATMGLAILTPLTFWVPPDQAFAMLLGLLSAAIFSGGIPAVLINTPGTPASIATTWDGHPLAQQGRAGLALGVNALAACFGQLVSVALLAVAAFPLAAFALRFGPPEYFALAVFGISMMVSVSSDSILKGLLMGAAGVALSLVGLDPLVGYPRFTLGQPALLGGVSFIPVMVGLFGVAEVLLQVHARTPHAVRGAMAIDRVLPSRADLRAMAPHATLASVIGTGVGVIPGAGGDIGAIVAWGQSRRLSRAPETFGRGSLAGLAASCAAANAAIGGALTTMLSLGIPGDSASAVLIGALLIHGLQPGPLLFRNRPDVVASLVLLLVAAALVTLVLGLLAARPLARILQVRDQVLWGLVLIVCLVGSYALNRSVADVWIMLAAGVAGFALRRAHFPMGPLVLGLILGPMAESNLRRALSLAGGDAGEILGRPITAAFLLLALLGLALPALRARRRATETRRHDATEPQRHASETRRTRSD